MKILSAVRFFAVVITVAIVATPAIATERYSITTSSQSQSNWYFQRLSAHAAKEGTDVSGRLSANSRFGLPHGYVEISAYSPAGNLLRKTRTDYQPAILTRKTKLKGGVRFSADLEKLPPDSTVKVAFYRDGT